MVKHKIDNDDFSLVGTVLFIFTSLLVLGNLFGLFGLVILGALMFFMYVKNVKDAFIPLALFDTSLYYLFAFISAFFQGEARIRDDVLGKPKQQNLVNNRLSDNRKDGVFSGKNANGDDLYISNSDRACVIGPPGTGKTTFLVNQLYRWLHTGNSFVCLDIKPEIYELTKDRLENEGYTCYIFNPTNPKDKYNFLGDLESPEAISELASAFIPSESQSSPVFAETARDFLDAIIAHLKAPTKKNPEPKPTLPDVYDFVVNFESGKALLAELSHSNSAEARAIAKTLKIMAENDRMLGSVFATFISNMRFLRLERIRESLGQDGFSLDVLKNKKVALFLQFEETEKITTSHLFGVMVGHMLRYLISNHNDREPVLLFLDEIGNAGIINDLTGKLNTIRSRKLPTWLYWQSTEQMQKYGKKANEGANVIMGACDLQMCFRLNDNATAKWFSEKIGTQEDVMISTGDTTSRSIALNAVIEPHEIMQLDTNKALYSYRDMNWLGEATPYYRDSNSLLDD